jgi:hypothetical protein
MSQQFYCDVCGVVRTAEEGSGQWFTVGINDYGDGGRYRKKKLNVYGWPLGCKSQQDAEVKHACSKSHMLAVVKKWAEVE